MAAPIVVCGATGRVGSALVAALVSRGATVRAFGRDTRALANLRAAETAQGSLDDRQAVAKACDGAAAVVAMVPFHRPSSDYRAHGARIVEAIAGGIERSTAAAVVAISAIGAELADGNGPWSVLHLLEERLRALGRPLTILRAAPHLDDWIAAIPRIRRRRGLAGAFLAARALPMVASRDVAAIACAAVLAGAPEREALRELHGAKDYAPRDVARTLGLAIGMDDMPYCELDAATLARELAADGASAPSAAAVAELQLSWNAGTVRPGVARDAATTTPTTLGQFAKAFAKAWRGG
jgi:uncharacterized protein YbjT (DUF2867 family)